jgi:hypothetical protein
MKNPSPKLQTQIDKYLQELQQLQAIKSRHETTRLFQEFEKKLALKMIACVDAIAPGEKNAIDTLLKLSKAMLLLRQFRC